MKIRLLGVVLIFTSIMFMGLIMVSSPSFAKAGIDYEDHLVGLWKFDEGKGTAIEDSSGNGLEGELKGGGKWVDGKFGKAIQLNGETGFVAIKPHANPTTDITVSAWVKSKNTKWNNKVKDTYIKQVDEILSVKQLHV